MTFIFDFSQLINKAPAKTQNTVQGQTAKITKLSAQLLYDTKFCIDSDFSVRTFGNYLYSIDGMNKNLHVYSIKDRQWNYSRLDDLG
eukprot:CAMPEP_0168621700 /NCGR_PEP_ID=MMETSP0449_2-20121227/7846_1 /TAXON_ID=1082188 /ORGANISM="Strombidium rassoulzadegani, Strain ras09" /LENGTH=86 /DNA_ID=CAMNT_0008662861 /DNA_START=102 /DNA_END=359 /DNA_ORIENTATION=+